ncbi:MAG: hypothetical protein AB2728_19495 [Candidatus Thiodiazotropha sp.]
MGNSARLSRCRIDFRVQVPVRGVEYLKGNLGAIRRQTGTCIDKVAY